MKTDLAPESSDLTLLRRADLPVIWDGFKAKAEELRVTAETLTITSVEQKDEMALARKTRLTLKEVRIAVEKKRVELGEGHLSEIQKINGAAKKLKEMIEPLEARLLHAETFAERVEADRVLELSKHRNDEVRAIWPGCPGDFGKMSDAEYAALIARLRHDAEVMAEAKRKQAEAGAALAAQQAAERKLREEQAAALAAQQVESQRQARAAAAEAEIKIAAERAERKRQEQELIDRLAKEQADKDAKRAAQEAEESRARAEVKRIEREEHERREAALRAELEAVEAKRRAERAAEEAKRLELEVQLANERAAKLAEERRLHALAAAPDKEQLKAFHNSIYQVPQPDLKTPEAVAILNRVQGKIAEAFLIIDVFCAE